MGNKETNYNSKYIYDIDFKVSKHKAIEIQLDLGWRNNMASEWFEFILRTKSRQDHWGFEFTLTLLNLMCFSFMFYDERHYYEEDTEEENT